MKYLVCLLLVICLGFDVSLAKSPSKPEILKTYADLLSFRTNDDAVLQGGQGVMVIKSHDGSSLKALDIVVAFNNKPVHSVNQLLEMTEQADVKNDIQLSIVRDGKSHALNLNKADFAAVYSDMFPAQVDQLISSQVVNGSKMTPRQDAMIEEYLKGRPYRTPNNREHSK